jgi:hypothetical protein
MELKVLEQVMADYVEMACYQSLYIDEFRVLLASLHSSPFHN